MTSVVFAGCTIMSILSVVLLLLLGSILLVGVVVSAACNVGALVISERHGFVRSAELRRAFEPQRHFNAAQVLTIVLLIMVQTGSVLYVLLVK